MARARSSRDRLSRLTHEIEQSAEFIETLGHDHMIAAHFFFKDGFARRKFTRAFSKLPMAQQHSVGGEQVGGIQSVRWKVALPDCQGFLYGAGSVEVPRSSQYRGQRG